MSRAPLPPCPVCSTVLTQHQVWWGNQTCSRPCGWTLRGHIRLPFTVREYGQRLCEACSTPLTRDQLRQQRQRFCSIPCANRTTAPLRAGPFAAEQTAVLELFRATEGQWMTYSDLCIWRYGDDTPSDINAMRTTMWRLRRLGYAFESRRFPWPTLDRQSIQGFRLIEAVKEEAA